MASRTPTTTVVARWRKQVASATRTPITQITTMLVMKTAFRASSISFTKSMASCTCPDDTGSDRHVQRACPTDGRWNYPSRRTLTSSPMFSTSSCSETVESDMSSVTSTISSKPSMMILSRLSLAPRPSATTPWEMLLTAFTSVSTSTTTCPTCSTRAHGTCYHSPRAPRPLRDDVRR
eukprot:scaffold2262_cov312-Prasinococcus_capsulatus_cf.AAC.14